ncbi:MAG: hypothetical protein ACOY0T_22355 [Myxococcota bacterium]
MTSRTSEFRAHPLFAFLSDDSKKPEERLLLAPALAHFVMTFADIYRFVLRDESSPDDYQKLVNAHTYEDGGHWKWFLADLKKLGHDPRIPFSEALRFIWSEETINLRLLSYNICRLGLGASSLRKLVLVQCIEATGTVMLSTVAPVGQALAARSGERLTYFGAHHFDSESSHTLEQDESQTFVESIALTPEQITEFCQLVDETFALFTAVADEMLAFNQRGRAIAAA